MLPRPPQPHLLLIIRRSLVAEEASGGDELAAPGQAQDDARQQNDDENRGADLQVGAQCRVSMAGQRWRAVPARGGMLEPCCSSPATGPMPHRNEHSEGKLPRWHRCRCHTEQPARRVGMQAGVGDGPRARPPAVSTPRQPPGPLPASPTPACSLRLAMARMVDTLASSTVISATRRPCSMALRPSSRGRVARQRVQVLAHPLERNDVRVCGVGRAARWVAGAHAPCC